MTDREKLIELVSCFAKGKYVECRADSLLDHLLANGVTFAKDTDVPSKWISVEDRLPEHGDVVLCWHKAKDYPIVLQLDKRSGCWLDDQWDYGMGLITHWMPLPEPPKED